MLSWTLKVEPNFETGKLDISVRSIHSKKVITDSSLDIATLSLSSELEVKRKIEELTKQVEEL